ncbi:hypothetical protein A3A20_01200 [Candidatus Wolfebacteria bacterium RIFCSPLOWO2_01_FULL_45_19]|uniref:Photosynthesis system II assembly factor Ycf48/Hcf136-like domain-containing protein n=1 Tax=Candidatus Wolfebacteria bacterium RIFCSPLOWO2_01_FULL_45_19 TaxID=1802557 RepID=A0A1F8DUR1_9BACT|nr:MAG: hypothetical protein UX23_C0004G0023 [Parcubacteria group bacterium GW2011_GWB1_45_9]OGM91548.1 MAG: hypothetical protein A3A20_01200 [Candidatus Wolfebacteria bacterium RIFCSPLOWO2_01_FULL_45_19]
MEDKAFFLILLVILVSVGIYAYTTSNPAHEAYFMSGVGARETTAAPFIAVSDDGGKTFKTASTHDVDDNRKLQVYDIKFIPGNEKLVYAGTNQGLLISKDDGMNWYLYADLEKKLDEKTQIYGITPNLDEPRQIFISAFKNDVGYLYETRDNFFTLENLIEFENSAIYSLDFNGGRLYMGLSDGRIMEYYPRSSTFRALAALGSPITDVLAKNGTGLIYAATKNKGVFVSANGGNSFKTVNGSSDYRQETTRITGDNLIYAASLHGLARTNDGGNNWTALNAIVPKNTPINAMTVDENGSIYASSGSMLYISRDYGFSWQTVRPLQNEREISVIRASKNRVIIGTQ